MPQPRPTGPGLTVTGCNNAPRHLYGVSSSLLPQEFLSGSHSEALLLASVNQGMPSRISVNTDCLPLRRRACCEVLKSAVAAVSAHSIAGHRSKSHQRLLLRNRGEPWQAHVEEGPPTAARTPCLFLVASTRCSRRQSHLTGPLWAWCPGLEAPTSPINRSFLWKLI